MTDSLSITKPHPITNMNDNINMYNGIEVSVTDGMLPTTTYSRVTFHTFVRF